MFNYNLLLFIFINNIIFKIMQFLERLISKEEIMNLETVIQKSLDEVRLLINNNFWWAIDFNDSDFYFLSVFDFSQLDNVNWDDFFIPSINYPLNNELVENIFEKEELVEAKKIYIRDFFQKQINDSCWFDWYIDIDEKEFYISKERANGKWGVLDENEIIKNRIDCDSN